MHYSLTSEADYLKQNTVKLNLRLEEQNRKQKKEKIQSKKWAKWNREENKLSAREWFKKRTRLELSELIKIGRGKFNYFVDIESSETRKFKILEHLVGNFSVSQLNKMRKEYLNGRLSKQLDTRKIEIAKHRSQHHYIQRRLFEIFRYWLIPGKNFRIVEQRGGRLLYSNETTTSRCYCVEWTGPFSVKSTVLPYYAAQTVEIAFDPIRHSWWKNSCSFLSSLSKEEILIFYSESVYDYIVSTGVRHMETQARWIIQDGDPNRMRTLEYQRKQAELNQLTPVSLFLQNTCPDPHCKKLLFCHHLKYSDSVYGQTSLHCACHADMLENNWGRPSSVIFGMSAKVLENGNLVLQRKCHCEQAVDSDDEKYVHSDSHFRPGCARAIAKGRQCELQVDLVTLINQDLQREKWEQFIQTDRPDLQNTPTRSLVNEYIGLV